MAFISMVGRLVQDPVIKYTQQGKQVTSIVLVDIMKNKDDKAFFIDVSFFGKLAEISGQHLKKSSIIEVAGVLRQNSWTGNDGILRQRIYVEADRMNFVPSLKKQVSSIEKQIESNNSRTQNNIKSAEEQAESLYNEVSLPF